MAGQTDENRLHVLRHAAFTARDVREMERPLLENGVPLMRMASAATAHVVAEMLEDEGVALEESNIVLLAGSGDNGGDGLFAATMLAGNGASVTAVAVGRTLHGEGFAAFVRAGGKVLILDPASEIPGCAAGFSAGEAGERLRAAVELAQHAHVARAGDGQAAAHGVALEGADDGLLATAHVDDLVGAHALHDVEVALDAAHVLGRIERQVVQVEAGAEGLALARQHDDAAILVHAHLDEEVVELRHLGVRHGVEVRGIVEAAHVHRAATVDDELLIVVLELRQMVILLIHAHWHYPFPCGFISFAS